MPTDPSILTNILKLFIEQLTGGYGRIFPDAWTLLKLLATLELVLAALTWTLSRDTNILAEIIWLTLKIGFFIFLVVQFPVLCQYIIDSFVIIGLKAGGSTMELREFLNPSEVARLGLVAAEPVFTHISTFGFIDGMRNLGDILISGISGLLILLAFFIIAIQVFVSFLEFYLLSAMALILIPWGIMRHSAFMAERAIGMVLAFGIRLMVLAFIVSVSFPIIILMKLDADPTWQQVFSLLLGCGAIAFLCWHAPGIAGGLLAGVPTLTAGLGFSTLIGGALAVDAIGRSLSGSGRQMVNAVRNGTKLVRRT